MYDSLQPVFYDGKLFFTSGELGSASLGYHNIKTLYATTGTLAWSSVSKSHLSMHTNPIIANGRHYLPEYAGFYVRDPADGRIIGVDKSFRGAEISRNILYGDYIICIRVVDEKEGIAHLVAVDISGDKGRRIR